MEKKTAFKAMPLRISILFFGIPATAVTLSIHYFIPHFHEREIPLYLNAVPQMAGLMALMLVASLIAFRAEGNRWSWLALKERFRLKRMDGKAWLWTVGLFAFMAGTYLGLAFSSNWLAAKFVSPPAWLAQAFGSGKYMDVSLTGNMI